MRNTRALGALSLLIASGAFAAAPLARPASASSQGAAWLRADDATFTRQRAEAEPFRDHSVRKALKAAMQGERYSPEELVIIDAYAAGLPIASIEAEALVSRVLFHHYIEGRKLAPKESDLLNRYLDYAKTHALELGERHLRLNESFGRKVQGQDDSREWELYSKPELWNQIDGLQRMLEGKYGRKGGFARLVHQDQESMVRNPFLQASPGSPILSLAGPLSPLANNLVNNIAADTTTQDTQSETSIILSGAGVVLSSFNDSGSHVPTSNNHFTGTSRSTDSGDTWSDQGTLLNSTNGDAGDPVFARNNTTGTVILATLGFTSGNVLPIFRSTDNGATWLAPVDGAGGTTAGSHDKEWVACDNFAGSGNGNFYMFWRNFATVANGGGMTFTRSTDDGATWGSRQVLASGSGQGAQVVVGADHAVYCAWYQTSPTKALVVRKSTDGGLTFGPAVTAATILSTGSNGDLGFTFRSSVFPQIIAHPTDASQLYMVWPDNPAGADRGDIYFAKTADGGATWSAPLRVNNDPGTNDQWQPVIAVTPDGTGLFVSWYDRRDDPGNTLFNVYARHAAIAGTTVTFDLNDYKVTDGASPVVIGQDSVIVATYMGDYDQATADNSFYYRTWGDNRLSTSLHTNQPDVRFTKVPKAGPGAIMGASGNSLVAEGCAPANGTVDPNESVTMSFSFKNAGTSATSTLVGTLLASGGVTIPGAPQSYGAVAAGATATRNFTFKAANQACGTSLTASVQLQDGATDLGTFTFPIPLYGLGAPTTTLYTSPGIAVPIPTTGTIGNMADQTINVPDLGTITDVNVKVRLNHTFDGDLKITLVSPNGTPVVLSSNRGSSGDNFGAVSNDCLGTFTVFDDAAATAIGSGTAPFAATYRPDGLLSAMNGGPSSGNWTLKINDTASGDSGFLYCWQIEVTRANPVCNTCVSSADLSITDTPSPSPTVAPGANISYSFVATNNGPDAADDVAINTTTPVGTTFVSASAPGSVLVAPGVGGTGPVTGTWAGSTANGSSHTLTMVVNVPGATPDGTVIPSSGTVASTTSDPTPGNNSANASVTVVVPSGPPSITSFSPTSGIAGTVVTLTGSNLNTTSDVKFNGISATFTPVSATQVKASVPAGATTGPISITTGSGTSSTAPVRFTVISSAPRITSFAPTSGPTGTVVTINGSNLGTATAVAFNGVAATSFTVISATQVKATVPAAATTGPITVTTPSGTATTGTVKFTKL